MGGGAKKEQHIDHKSLGIVAIKPFHEYSHPPVKHPILPQHEFGLLVVAPPGSGKTNLICNLLLNHYKGYFHEIHICSPTVKNDPKWDRVLQTKGLLVENKKLQKALGKPDKVAGQKVPDVVYKSQGRESEFGGKAEESKFDGKLPEDAVFEDLEQVPIRLAKQNETLEELLKLGIKSDEAKFLLNRVLVIEDDMAGLYRDSSKRDPQTNVVFKRRHYGCSMIKVTQMYKAMPSGHRKAMSAIICFEIPNIRELETLYEEWQMGMNHDDWLQVYKYCTNKPFGFLYYNVNLPRGERVYRNFEEQITMDDNEDIEGDKRAIKQK